MPNADPLRARLGTMDSSSRGAALLLMKVRKIAMNEMFKTASPIKSNDPPKLALVAGEEHSASSLSDGDSDTDSDADSWNMPTPPTPTTSTSTPTTRCRLVSMGSYDLEGHLVSPMTQCSSVTVAPRDDTRIADAPKDLEESSSSDVKKSQDSLPENSDREGGERKRGAHRCYVGEQTHGPIKGVLRKKFSWKNYPELENYLVENRAQYLQYSSRLNYTAAQKQYNNQLTKGLLELAAEKGYVFESFTFPAVRDRIRCYYKSFVQAGKKQKRKKRR